MNEYILGYIDALNKYAASKGSMVRRGLSKLKKVIKIKKLKTYHVPEGGMLDVDYTPRAFDQAEAALERMEEGGEGIAEGFTEPPR